MDVRKTAETIVEYAGTKENLTNVTNCMTRLRIRVRDESKLRLEDIKAMQEVMGVVEKGGEYQIVLGPGAAAKVCDEVAKAAGIDRDAAIRDDEAEKADSGAKVPQKAGGIVGRMMDVISSVFVPLIPVIAASGTLKGILAVLVQAGLLNDAGSTYQILYGLANTVFYFFPVVLGFTAGKKFGATPYITAVLGAAIMCPEILGLVEAGEGATLFGLPVTLMNYSTSVLPIIFASYGAAKLEQFFKKYVPNVMQIIFVPLLTLIIIYPLTLFIIGPVLTELNNLLCDGVMAVYGFSPVIAGFIIAGVWQLTIFAGIGWGFVIIFLGNIEAMGYSPVLALVACTIFAQGGAALAAGLRAKNKKYRSVGISAGIAAILGVSEPALYGINVPAKKPFFIALGASAVGGVIAALFGARQYSIGPSGIFQLPVMIDPAAGVDIHFVGVILSILVGFVGAFIVTFLFGYKNTILDREE